MEIAHGARGVVIGDRYRVAGALRRTGLMDAVDLEADRAEAACRLVGIPGDAEGIDAWENAWREAQVAARLPRLREIVRDDDGLSWAALDASQAAGGAPAGADAAARRIGVALAAAGLDVDDVTATMLAVDAEGRLILDGVVWLGGTHGPRAAGQRIEQLLPADDTADHDDDRCSVPDRASARSLSRRGRRRRTRRLLLPVAIIALLAAAAGALLLPQGSSGTAPLAPAPPSAPDVLLGATSATPRDAAVVAAAPNRHRRPRRPRPVEAAEVASTGSTAAAPPVGDVAALPEPVAAAAALPAAAAEDPPDLPLADPAPALPAAAAG